MKRTAGKDRVEGMVREGYGLRRAKEVLGAVGESQFPRMLPGYRDHLWTDVQTNEAGVKLELTAAFDASVYTANPAGVTAYVGQIDTEPIAIQKNAAGVTWTLYEMR